MRLNSKTNPVLKDKKKKSILKKQTKKNPSQLRLTCQTRDISHKTEIIS
jgi:hypothetical protein